MILNSLFGGNYRSPLTLTNHKVIRYPPMSGGSPPGPPFYFVLLHTIDTKEDEFIIWLNTRVAKLFSNIIYIKGGGVRGNLGSPEKVNLKSSESYINKNGSF